MHKNATQRKSKSKSRNRRGNYPQNGINQLELEHIE